MRKFLALCSLLLSTSVSAKTFLENPCIEGKEPSCRRRALDAFEESLRTLESKKSDALTRVLHFGDSIIAADYISSTLRKKLQEQFGDAGRGFSYAVRPSAFHAIDGVSYSGGKTWKVSALPEPKTKDGLLGLGGALLTAKTQGARFGLSSQNNVSAFSLFFLKQPKGGEFQIYIDGVAQEKVSTEATSTQAEWKTLNVSDGQHKIEIESLGSAPVSFFGVALDRAKTGVSYDTLGAVSGSYAYLLKIDDGHWKKAVGTRNPSLLVYSYGTNEANYTGSSSTALAEYQATIEKVLARGKQAAPKASCLVIGPLDAAEKVVDASGAEKLQSKAVVGKLVEAQRKAAVAQGCAFYDAFEATGGKGVAVSWVEKGLLAADLAHPSPGQAGRVGSLVYKALLEDFEAFKKR